MEELPVAATLSTITDNVGTLVGSLTGMFTSLSSYWFVFLPISFIVFGFVFGKFKSILMFRKGKRRR